MGEHLITTLLKYANQASSIKVTCLPMPRMPEFKRSNLIPYRRRPSLLVIITIIIDH